MKRDEFMAQIARLLADMPDNERMEAIRYYNDYLDEAGEENEEEAIRELGNPQEIAANIKANLQEQNFETYGENGSGSGKCRKKNVKKYWSMDFDHCSSGLCIAHSFGSRGRHSGNCSGTGRGNAWYYFCISCLRT